VSKKRKRWVTVVGEHIEVPERPGDPVARGEYLDSVRPMADPSREVSSFRMRDRLLYERGVGPLKPDDKPEPSGGPRNRKGFRPSPRPPKVVDGSGED
jgi:hypothetical protein